MRDKEEIVELIQGLRNHYKEVFGQDLPDSSIESALNARLEREREALVHSCLQLRAEDVLTALTILKEPKKKADEPKAKSKAKAKSRAVGKSKSKAKSKA